MRLFLPRLLELHILSQLFPPALPHSPWWWSGNVPWCPTHTSDCTQSIQTTERALAADSLYPKTASIEWYSFIHRQCHVTPPTPNTPKKKLTLTFCHQISLLLKKTNETPAFSGVTYLSTSATQRCHKKWTKSQVQQLWIHHIHTMLLTTRPNFLPDEKQRVFPMSDLGAVGLPGPGTVKLVIIEIHIFFSNHPAVCGRVEFPPIPPPHLELYDMFHWENFGIHAKTSLIPIHTAHDQYFMFMLGLDYLLKQPYFKRRSSPRGLYVPHLKAIYNGASRGFLKSVICPPPPPHHLQIFSRVVHPKIFKVQLAGFRWFLHVNVPIPAGNPKTSPSPVSK